MSASRANPPVEEGRRGRVRLITPVTPALLVTEVADLVAARPGRVRLAVDGAPPTRPRDLADAVAVELRTRGRAAVVVDAGDYLRPASLRLEYGRTDPTPSSTAGSTSAACAGRCSPRRRRTGRAGCCRGCGMPGPTGPTATLRRPARRRRRRARRRPAARSRPATGPGGAPADDAAALARRLPADLAWTLPAYARYETEHAPADEADLLVLADHPDRPAVRRNLRREGNCGRGGS